MRLPQPFRPRNDATYYKSVILDSEDIGSFKRILAVTENFDFHGKKA